MITVIGRWEHLQMEPQLEWRMWRQLKGFGIMHFAFSPIIPELSNINIDQYDTMAEALEAHKDAGTRVFLEPTGTKTMNELPDRSEDLVLILGSTDYNNLKHAKEDETYRISGVYNVDMYPTSAAAVALAYWNEQ